MSFCDDSNFINEYLSLYNSRFTSGSLAVEYSEENTSSKKAMEFYNNLEALKYAMSCDKDSISHYDIIEIAGIVNGKNSVFKKGYRNTNVEIRGATWLPSEAKDVPYKTMSLIDCYRNVWKDLDIFTREARFHIELIKIHPFEDGNGRTARILMAANFLMNDIPPVIISSLDRHDYFQYITNDDYDGFAEFLRSKSLEEASVMRQLEEQLNAEPVSNFVR
jgi:Fic family protein